MQPGASRSLIDASIQRARSTPSTSCFPSDVAAGGLFGGAAGVAFFLHEAARLRAPDLMKHAGDWADCAEAWASTATPRDWEPVGLPGQWGLLQGLGGVAYVRVLVSSSSGDTAGIERGVRMLLEACTRMVTQETASTALFEGAAGLLCAARQLRRVVGPRLETEVAHAGENMLRFVLARFETPLAGRNGRLGMAHGLAGELWATIGALDAQPLPAVVRARASELLAAGARDDHVLLFSSRLGQPIDDLVHGFCNGMAGQALLWTRLAARTREPEAGEAARLAVNTLHLLGPAPVPSLCCGMAGQAVAHVVASHDLRSKIDGPRGRARIRRAAERAHEELEGPYALHLWAGPLGVATAALLREAHEAHVPCLELHAR
jgi:hypothetical protein